MERALGRGSGFEAGAGAQDERPNRLVFSVVLNGERLPGKVPKAGRFRRRPDLKTLRSLEGTHAHSDKEVGREHHDW